MPISTGPAGTAAPVVPVVQPGDAPAGSGIGPATGILLRFVSCGLLCIVTGLAWKFTLAPARMGVGSALVGMLCLLAGFVVGGILWYVRDARLRSRHPERVSDERIVFSFVVFALVPFAVGALVALIWVLALFIGL